ncbi:MAG: M81 family metallopeptidase [Chloroflexi bacterium]|nr:M81 family metallopeptidase [Chloroflexota bacterium]
MDTTGRFRIAVGGITHESSTFSPLPARLDDFDIRRGDDLLRAFGVAADARADLVPTLLAQAQLSGGQVERAAYLRLAGELIERLRGAGPVDGVCLALHGSMEVEDIGKGEEDLLTAIRAVVGREMLIAVSLDLHANATPAMVALADVLTSYRTAPHRDARQTRQRALNLLVRCLQRGIRPAPYLVKLPLVLQGEKAITDAEPMASLVRLVEEISQAPGMLDASVLVGFAWADVPYATTGVIAVAGGDAALARRQAERLAAAVWEARERFAFDVETGTLDHCIDIARAALEPTVFITDSGDNPTAGAPGDVPLFVERLLAKDVPDAVCAAIPDPEAVAACREAGVGAMVTLMLGGKLDPVTSPPLELAGWVEHLSAHGAGADDLAVVRVRGVRVILTARRRAFLAPEHFREAGIEPLEHKLVVVKQGYLFTALRRIAPRMLMALTPGLTDQVLERLPYRNLPRPVFPLDPVSSEWRP